MSKKEKDEKIVLSASKISKYLECSWSYYCSYVLRFPESVHPKTRIGTLVHSILEFLAHERYNRHYRAVVENSSIYASSRITKLVQAFQKRYKLEDKLINEVNDMVFIALNNDFWFQGSEKIYNSEFAFELDLGDNVFLRGFIDRMAEFTNKFKIRDYKTAKNKFTGKKLTDNIQASVYQLAIYKYFQKMAEVEFNFLRFKKSSLCTVKPKSQIVLDGFVYYIKYLAKKIQKIDEKEAQKNFLAKTDPGFCKFVCGYKDPMTFYQGYDKEGKIVFAAFEKKDVEKHKDVDSVKKYEYLGCPFFHKHD